MQETSFVIEADPVPASRPKVTARGMTYYPKKHTQYSEYLKQFLKTVPPFKTEGPVEVRMLFVMPRYKASDSLVHRADLDNLAKLPLDSITKCKSEEGESHFWADDHMVVNLTVMKRFALEDEVPHTRIVIRTIEGSVEDYIDRKFNA